MNALKPIVGIVSKPVNMTKSHLWHRFTLVDDLRFLVVKNGGIAIGILPSEETLEFHWEDDLVVKSLSYSEIQDLDQELQLCQGLILQGGLASNFYEVVLAKLALARDMPVLGICAGFNNLLRAMGGDVVYDKTESHNIENVEFRHKVLIREGTKLAEILGKREILTNSIHTMIATEEIVAPYARVNAVSEDGLVEGFEILGKRFAVGTKWHPELLRDDEATKKLFAEFMRAVRDYAQAEELLGKALAK